MLESNIQNIALGLGIGVIVGELLTWLFVYSLRRVAGHHKIVTITGLRESGVRIRAGSLVIERLTGILERLVYIFFLVSNVGAAGAFIGTWILIKIIAGWNIRQAWVQNETAKRDHMGQDSDLGLLKELTAITFISLHGNLVSLLFAFLGAYLWCPEAF